MQTIKLRKNQWFADLGKPLAPPGGFGQVFAGKSLDGADVAIKRLSISSDAAGNRELSIAEELAGHNFKHVIPVYDSGIDAESGRYFVVMAKADRSLQDELRNGPIEESTAVGILSEIVEGLQEIRKIVHRDLKPANILLHEGAWKIADFGIARFVEESTSLNTLRECLSPLYAAPEQWRLEKASQATDIYALGCIAFALLTGTPPFATGNIRERHLHEEPPAISASSRFQQLVFLCLRKNPNARPSTESVLAQLEGMMKETNSSSPLASAGAVVAEAQAKQEAETARIIAERQRRQELARDGLQSLDLILTAFFAKVAKEAPVSRKLDRNRGIELGYGKLIVKTPFPFLERDTFTQWGKDIVCGALILVEQDVTSYRGRSANLWYGNIGNPNTYRWWEVAYYSWAPVIPSNFNPFGIDDQEGLRPVDFAGSVGIHRVAHAAPPLPVDGEFLDSFIERWTARLAAASQRHLQHPSHLSEE